MPRVASNIVSRRSFIEREFDEPLRDVVAGFIPLGLTRRETAETLGVSVSSLRRFCEREEVRFPTLSERRHRGGHFVEQTEERRRERIAQSMRAKAPLVEFRGQSLPLAEWSDRLGISADTLRHRVARRGSLFV